MLALYPQKEKRESDLECNISVIGRVNKFKTVA